VGADRPGDLAHILAIASPDAVVVTKLPDVPVHVEAYASPAAVREEEFAPAYALSPGAPLIVSEDDGYSRELAARLHTRVISYGFSPNASIRLMGEAAVVEHGVPVGMRAFIEVEGKKHEIKIQGALGRPQLYAPAAAVALALSLGGTAEKALKGLREYVPPPGRMRILRGKNEATLLDDTYNASPAAEEEALDAFALVPGTKRRVAILGDMLELGRFSKEQHERIGRYAAERADVVIGVGPRSEALVSAARGAGRGTLEAHHYLDSVTAAEALSDFARPGDLILIKGSQSVRMERIVAALLRDAEDAELLVRQEPEWLRR
jgi:UDP-N-acetylmuramyl pentapeptide synthase